MAVNVLFEELLLLHFVLIIYFCRLFVKQLIVAQLIKKQYKGSLWIYIHIFH